MKKNIFVWKRVMILTAVFVAAVIISAFAGTLAVSDTVYFPLSDVRSAVSIRDAAVYSLEHCTSSVIQLTLLFVSSFSLLSFVCAVMILLYRGVSLGFAAALISRDALMASGGGILSFKSVLPILVLYFLSSLLMIGLSASSVPTLIYSRSVPKKKRCLSFCVCFAVISGAVFLIDMVKVWLV